MPNPDFVYTPPAGVSVGDILTADGSSSCIAAGTQVQVKAAPDGKLYVECTTPPHYLCSDGTGALFGFGRAANEALSPAGA